MFYILILFVKFLRRHRNICSWNFVLSKSYVLRFMYVYCVYSCMWKYVSNHLRGFELILLLQSTAKYHRNFKSIKQRTSNRSHRSTMSIRCFRLKQWFSSISITCWCQQHLHTLRVCSHFACVHDVHHSIHIEYKAVFKCSFYFISYYCYCFYLLV